MASESRQPVKILSIQSHVSYGYVGNRSAVFPLQCMGFDVIAVNTVQFSNHTGYPHYRGDVFPRKHISEVLKGLKEQDLFKEINTIISGYMGDSELAELVIETVSAIQYENPAAVYLCDPVMGDEGRGIYVNKDLPYFFQNQAVKHAKILTPNLFELALLTDFEIRNYDDIAKACRKLHSQGVEIILVTSVIIEDTGSQSIEMIASQAKGDILRIEKPRLNIDPAPNGAGDLTAALFCGHIIRGKNLCDALEATAETLYQVFCNTLNSGSRELALIQSREFFK